jgi:hypothetical protein
VGKNEMCQAREPRIVFQFSGYSLHSTKRRDGIVAMAEAHLRLIRRDDNLPVRSMRITVQAGPESDEGEALIFAADVEEQLVDVLKILKVVPEDASGCLSEIPLARGEEARKA